MRFSSILVSLAASIGSAIAVNVGQLTVTPSTLKLGDLFVVEYNSTQAVAHPQFVDFYVHDGQTDALYQLMRFTYPAQTNAYFFQKALPVIDSKATNEGYVAGAKYDITALVTYPVESGTLTVGRIDAPIQVQV